MNAAATSVRRCVVALVLAVSTGGGCASFDKSSRQFEGTPWTVRVQGLGSEIESCRALLLGWRGERSGHRLGILELSDTSPLARSYGAFAGIEGAPIFDPSGVFVGAVLSSVGQQECRLCAFAEAATLERLWLAGRRSLLVRPVELAPAPTATLVRAGDAVALAHWWSDSPAVAREFGTIAEVRDDQAIFLTTTTQAAPLTLRGHDLQVLLSVRTVAMGSMSDRFARVVAVRGPIGTVLYRGAHGCFAVLNRLPPSLSLQTVLRTGGETSSIDVHVVSEDGYTARNVSEFVTTYLREYGLARPGSARVSFTCDDHPALETTVTAGEDSSLEVAVDRVVSVAIAAITPPPGSSLVLDVALEETRSGTD